MRLDVAPTTQWSQQVGPLPETSDASVNESEYLAQHLYEPSRPFRNAAIVLRLPESRPVDHGGKRGVEDGREQLEAALWNAFDAEPLEDGMTHPGEQIIAMAVQESGRALGWLRRLALTTTAPAFAASTLRCLCRIDVGTSEWRTRLVADVLASEDVQMRDAALQAAEEWGGVRLRELLESHLVNEPVDWLRQAMEDVVQSM